MAEEFFNAEVDAYWLGKILQCGDADETELLDGSVEVAILVRVRLNRDQQEAALITYPGVAPEKSRAAYARNIIETHMERPIS